MRTGVIWSETSCIIYVDSQLNNGGIQSPSCYDVTYYFFAIGRLHPDKSQFILRIMISRTLLHDKRFVILYGLVSLMLGPLAEDNKEREAPAAAAGLIR